jgi:hypothetical protein
MKIKKQLVFSDRPVEKNTISSEEAKNIPVPASSGKKPSDFFGIFAQEVGEKFEKHIQKVRKEWDRHI